MKRMLTLLSTLTLTLCLCIPALAVYEGVYVYDPDGVLEETDAETMEARSASLTDTYDCAVYLFTVEDFTDYGYDDIYEFAQDYYEENLLGCGEDRDGILLTLSTETRDVSLAIYGPWAQTAFTDYGQEILWDAILDDFGNDDWDGGCADYLNACEELLNEAQNGTPVDVPETPGSTAPVPDSGIREDIGGHTQRTSLGAAVVKGMGKALLPAVIIAFLICGILKRKMKTARKASGAAAYISGTVNLKVKSDRYTHSTVVRTPIKTDNGPKGGGPHVGGGHHGGGGHHTSVNSRGFSGGSRKF